MKNFIISISLGLLFVSGLPTHSHAQMVGAQKPSAALKTQESFPVRPVQRIVKTIPQTIIIKKGVFTVKCKGKAVAKRPSVGVQIKQNIYSSKMPVISTRNQTVKMRQLDMSKSC